MSKSVGDLAGQIATSFQLNKAAGWDRVGLQFGDPSAAVSRVAVCHEVTPEVATRLVAENVDMAVAYHPLLFHPVTSMVAGTSPAGLAFELISNRVALSVVHTAFDVMPGGTADALATALGIEDARGFGPGWGRDTVKVVVFAPEAAVAEIVEAMASAGAGEIGAYSACSFRTDGVGSFYPETAAKPTVGDPGTLNHEPEVRIEMVAPSTTVDRVVAALVRVHPYEEPAYDVVDTRSNAGFIGRVGDLESSLTVATLAELVSTRLGGSIRVAGAGPVTTVAVIPGSGASFLGTVDADVVVTGDVSHHQARAATARGIAVVDPGHAATERPGVKALYASVAEMIGDVIDMTDVDADPWKER